LIFFKTLFVQLAVKTASIFFIHKETKKMGLQIPFSTSFQLPDGRTVTLETGKLATQTDGSAVVRVGNTMLLATAVSAREAKAGQEFFPLSVDYQEKFAAAGRIPGNFFRRETKLSDYEVLVSRLVDRAIRPLFPDDYMNETQIIISLMSVDKDEMPDALAGLVASTALAVSDIPVQMPISEVRVARIDGEFVINPGKTALANADLDLIVAGSSQDIMMVEGEAKECSEEDLVAAIKEAHKAIKVQINAQLELAKMVGDKAIKREVKPFEEKEEIKKEVETLIKDKILALARSASGKTERKNTFKKIYEECEALMLEVRGEEGAAFLAENKSYISRYFDKAKKRLVREVIINEKLRLDGRKLDEVRPIWCEVNYLPMTHGSAIFNRGETQSLTSVTLGTKLDQAMVDTAQSLGYEKFLLHYNFPGFSVGEVKPQRAPGRREVGHANLAGRSLRQVFPEDYPYTVRVVSDILESNGSSSMATVCAGSMALMDAGVPIKKAVSGIAMGMITIDDKMAILSDILGDEDALGDMDFKVTGTEDGICGCQMDMKIDGMPYEWLEQALAQAKNGRLHILNKMSEAISEPNEDLKPHAPRIVEVRIDRSFIGAVIGPGGSIIQEMQRETGTTINIEEVGEEGVVSIFGQNKDSLDAALARIKTIVFVPEVGDVFDGKVVSIHPFGVFVEFGNKSGLLHVSEMSYSKIGNVEEVYKVGDPVQVKLIEIDRKTGKYRLSHKALLPVPEGDVPPVERERREGGRDNRGGGGGFNRNRDSRDGGRDNRDRGGNRDNRPPRR